MKSFFKYLHRNRRFFIYFSIISPALLIFISFLMPTWEGQRFVLFYLPPIFCMMFYWIYLRLCSINEINFSLVIIDIFVLILSAIRFVGILPFSGHVLFFSYSFFTTKSKTYKILAFIFFCETTYFKLSIWSDWHSFVYGLITALFLIVLHSYFKKQKSPSFSEFIHK